MVCFELSMPQINTWNGHWSGENKKYVVLKPSSKRLDALDGQSHWYDFGDGWAACVDIKKVSRKEANRLKKLSSGFMGYEWMINSIIWRGRIQTGAC